MSSTEEYKNSDYIGVFTRNPTVSEPYLFGKFFKSW